MKPSEASDETAAQGTRWRVDQRLNVAFILAALVQLGVVFSWSGDASARIRALETRIDGFGHVEERLARIESQVAGAKEQLNRIETSVENLRDRVEMAHNLKSSATARGNRRGQALDAQSPMDEPSWP